MKKLFLYMLLGLLLASCSEPKKSTLENCTDYYYTERNKYNQIISDIHELKLSPDLYFEAGKFFTKALYANNKEIKITKKTRENLYLKLTYKKKTSEEGSKSGYVLSHRYKEKLMIDFGYDEFDIESLEKTMVKSYWRLYRKQESLKAEKQYIRDKGNILYGKTKAEALRNLNWMNKVKMSMYMHTYKNAKLRKKGYPIHLK